MKLEIVKEFSSVYLTERFYVLVDHAHIGSSYETEELARTKLSEIKNAYLATLNPAPEVVYSEEVWDQFNLAFLNGQWIRVTL